MPVRMFPVFRHQKVLSVPPFICPVSALRQSACAALLPPPLSASGLLKMQRNKLAHGEASFEEVGREISSQQIEKLTEKTFDYLEKATQAVTCYLSNKNYLKAQHNR